MTNNNCIQQHMKVAVRVRPNSRRELELNQVTIIKVIDNQTILFDPDEEEDEFFFQGIKLTHRDITKKTHKKLSMEYDQVFNGDATNVDIFNNCTKPLISNVMDGYNCSVFVYGATGAGKTYTMLGNHECPGITYLTMKELFQQISSYEETRKFDIGISYLEVYNEQVKNLLNKSGPLKLREDINGVVVSGLALKPIYNAQELLTLLELGNCNRTQHPTDANAESSRSHAIFQVHIRMTDKKTGQKRTVKLSMIDLAGSERAASTKGIGVRFKEGASINKSLLALGNCINNLADGLKHIPYRDSNLTRILKDSLGGNCQTIMIANVSPSSLTYEDTYNTLKYASRAKKICITARQNIMKANMPKEYYVKNFYTQQSEIDKLKEQIKQLENKLAATINVSSNNVATITTTTAHEIHNSDSSYHTELQCWYDKIDKISSALIKTQECYFNLQSKEKILLFRTNLKEKAEQSKKILILDGADLNEDIARLEASIDRLGKQIVKKQDDIVHWRQLYQENLFNLRKLRKEIENLPNNQQSQLQIYMNGKCKEITISEQNIQMAHTKKVNLLYATEHDHMHKLHISALEIIQRNYYLFRAKNLIDTEYQEKLEIFKKMCNGHGIKFNKDQQQPPPPNGTNSHNIDLKILNLDHPNDYDDQTTTTLIMKNKRTSCEDENDDEHFNIVTSSNLLLPKRNRKLFKNNNETIIMENNTHDDGGIHFLDPNEFTFKQPRGCLKTTTSSNSVTFGGGGRNDNPNETFEIVVPLAIPSVAASSSNQIMHDNAKEMEVMKHILNEENVSATKREQINKALMKSNIKREALVKTVNAGIINKENKIHHASGRIRKSPRADSKGSSSSATATFLTHKRTKTHLSAKKAFGCNYMNKGDAAGGGTTGPGSGIVRTNRAAFLRNKK